MKIQICVESFITDLSENSEEFKVTRLFETKEKQKAKETSLGQ